MDSSAGMENLGKELLGPQPGAAGPAAVPCLASVGGSFSLGPSRKESNVTGGKGTFLKSREDSRE